MTRTTISAITIHCVDAPIDPPLRNSLNVISRAPLVIADVTTGDGAMRTAYVFPCTRGALGPTATLARSIGEGLIGRECWRKKPAELSNGLTRGRLNSSWATPGWTMIWRRCAPCAVR